MSYDFKKEEDVKEYLENLGIEYRFECFHEKKPDGCHRLGDYLEAIKKDFKKAARMYQTACDDHKYGLSCYKYGNYSFLGRGCKKDLNTALTYFKLGCDYDNAEACLHAGLMLTTKEKDKKDLHQREFVLNNVDQAETGATPVAIKETKTVDETSATETANQNSQASPAAVVVEEDTRKFKEGVQLFDRGCAANNATSCFFASTIYMMGTLDVPKDYTKAFQYSVKACDMGNVYACANLSRMYTQGNGTPKNEEMAQKYKARAIDLKNQHLKQYRPVEFGRT